MSTTGERCSRAQAAAEEVLLEACDGVGGEMVEVAPDVFVFVRDGDETDLDAAPDLDELESMDRNPDIESVDDLDEAACGDGRDLAAAAMEEANEIRRREDADLDVALDRGWRRVAVHCERLGVTLSPEAFAVGDRETPPIGRARGG